MRKALAYIIILAFAGCDNGFDPVPVVEEVRFTIDIQVTDRSLAGDIHASATCSVSSGGIRVEPDQIVLQVDGVIVASASGSRIESTVTLSALGEHMVAAECKYGDETGLIEQSVEVVEPVWITVHLRNFTQEGEPFVRSEGPITFTVGDTQITSEDSAVVPVLPGFEHEVMADHPDFLHYWARIQDHDTGELLEFYQIRDQSSPVRVESSVAVDVVKLRESDITAGPPSYTVHQLRTVFYGDYTPLAGAMRRYVNDSIGVHVSVEDLDRLPTLQPAIEKLFLGDGPYHVSKLTHGAIQYAHVSTEPFPRDYPVIYVSSYFGPYANPSHRESTDYWGVIGQSSVTFTAGTSDRTAVAFFLHALGLSGTVNGEAVYHFTDLNANPSRFALLALKILYASPPNTRF